MSEQVEGELVSDLLPLKSGSIQLTGEELEELLKRAAFKGYQLAEAHRQAFLTTPDGLLDRTIHAYEPVPYTQALSESSPILDIPDSQVPWYGTEPNELPSEIAAKHFLSYPPPLPLLERIKTDESS